MNTTPSMPTRRALLAAAAAGSAAPLMFAFPLQAAVPAADHEAALRQFQQAAASGNATAIGSAAEQFGRLAASEPGDPVLLAYSGAATAMRATTTMLPWRKLAFADDGLAQIDKALAMLDARHDALLHRQVPASLETRFVAANTFLRMPAMFNRHPRGVRLLDEVLQHPLFASAPLPFRATVWMLAADQAAKDRRPEHARQWLQRVVASGAPQAAQAQSRLQGLNP
ncbi:MAG TPA: hypothetical protein VGE16_09720 [Albitalea sp.]